MLKGQLFGNWVRRSALNKQKSSLNMKQIFIYITTYILYIVLRQLIATFLGKFGVQIKILIGTHSYPTGREEMHTLYYSCL